MAMLSIAVLSNIAWTHKTAMQTQLHGQVRSHGFNPWCQNHGGGQHPARMGSAKRNKSNGVKRLSVQVFYGGHSCLILGVKNGPSRSCGPLKDDPRPGE
eukprot:1150705-Pelagomonas_calceolata.AAC.3